MIQEEEYDLFLNDIENMPVFIRFYRATERLIKTFEEYQIEDDNLFIKGNELLYYFFLCLIFKQYYYVVLHI